MFCIPNFVFAQSGGDKCSKDGFTVLLINGMSTSDSRAEFNLETLDYVLPKDYKKEIINADYLLNPSHFAGLGDALDVINQKLYENNGITDFDFLQMWQDASEKVQTQKVLLVGHSQGNFYVNSFYNVLADREGGVPSRSMSVYGVASPASYVAGGGKYITSSNDKIINNLRVGNLLNILASNVVIPPTVEDVNGHDFTKVYMEYQGDRIINEILATLNNLSENDIQQNTEPCIGTPPTNFLDKITEVVYVVSDPVAGVSKQIAVNTLVGTYKGLSYIGNFLIKNTAVLASSVSSIIKSLNSLIVAKDVNTASAILVEEIPAEVEEEVVSVVQEQVLKEIKDPFTDNKLKEDFQTVVLNEPLVLEPKIEVPLEVLPLVVEDHGPQPIVQVRNDNPGSPTPVVQVVTPDPEPEPEAEEPTPTPDTTPPVITLSGNASVYIKKNSTYTDAGATASDAVDGTVSVSTSGTVDTATIGTYTITYTATDTAGNTSTSTRNVKVSSYVYLPKNTFGTDNGDGNDWQVWLFNGSYIYDWYNTYENNYLKQSFKVQSLAGYSCGQCLQRGIFTVDPEKGFETSNLSVSFYENLRIQNATAFLYEITTLWDAAGYTYTTMEAGVLYDTGHVDVANVNSNMYVGWDGSHNNFQTFPSGHWTGFFHPAGYGNPNLPDYFAGQNMIIQPYAVYTP